MSALLEVPRIADLDGLPVEVAASGTPGVVAVAARASDGAVVTLTWDEVAGSVSIRWVEAGDERLALEREIASKVRRGRREDQQQARLGCSRGSRRTHRDAATASKQGRGDARLFDHSEDVVAEEHAVVASPAVLPEYP